MLAVCLVSLSSLCSFSGNAFGKEAVRVALAHPPSAASATPKCDLEEQSRITINKTDATSDLNQYKDFVTNKMTELTALAKESGLEKIELETYNLNINPNPNGVANGSGAKLYMSYINMSIFVVPSAKAFDFMTALEKKGFSPALNVNTYRSCK